ncbi:conserved protein, unknown function [Hepatocystis sp. ex Piliocolobus tephrosceles]|nr:conserved protein, unknown function [Hepatocystis sp. ex Piliocolobus tephrosceles]
MPHNLTSFIAALTGSIGSGTCCGCIPFTFAPSVAAPGVASTAAPITSILPSAAAISGGLPSAIPAAVATQSAVSSTPVLTSFMTFFAPLLAFSKISDFFSETNRLEKESKDKTCQCNLINVEKTNGNQSASDGYSFFQEKSHSDNEHSIKVVSINKEGNNNNNLATNAKSPEDTSSDVNFFLEGTDIDNDEI